MTGKYGTVVGGRDNEVTGDYSFAAGRSAVANEEGSYVFADSSGTTASPTTTDQARFQVDVDFAGTRTFDGGLGTSVHRGISPSQSISAGPGRERIEFNKIRHDDRDEWDDEEFEFVAESDGSYLLTAGATFIDSFDPDDHFFLRVMHEDDRVAESDDDGQSVVGARARVSKIVHGVEEGDALWVEISLNTDEAEEYSLSGGSDDPSLTYFDIVQIA